MESWIGILLHWNTHRFPRRVLNTGDCRSPRESVQNTLNQADRMAHVHSLTDELCEYSISQQCCQVHPAITINI